jgi:ribosomal protein S18 acetylase RimI-like enzyme
MDYKRDYGMSMMLNAIVNAKCKEKKYVYLGSGTRPADKYKLQFPGIEWFDGEKWQTDVEALKKIIANSGADALIRRAQIEDAKDITDVHIKTWQTTYENEFGKEYLDSLSTPKEFAARLDRWIKYFVSCQSMTLVAIHDDKVVGFSNFGRARDTGNRLAGEIYSIYVLKEFQHKGVGKALLDATIEEMHTAYSYSYVSLLTLSTNTISQKFFEKNNFKKMPIEIKNKVDKFDVVQFKYELPIN